MIIRKPYAFLIKNFRKIHIFLLLLCGYIYYKNMQTSSFIKEFSNLGTYDAYNEPITKYISGLVFICLLLIIITNIILVFLLRYKQKPWKLYLLPVIEYSIMLITFMVTKNFFNNYDGTLETASVRAIRDIIFILSFFEYPVFLILLMRIFGVDLHKFNFKTDQEYLELNSADREELEINIDIDKESIKRLYKRFLRNLNYVYQEHKLIINLVIVGVFIVMGVNTYRYIFITHKSYQQGQSLNANGYTITINDSYYTDKNYTGDVISDKSNFVIVDLTIKNNSTTRSIDLNKFHIMNGVSNYTTTHKTYGTEFQDFGDTYQEKEMKANEEFDLIMVFRVDKKLNKDKFVLYYQEVNNGVPYLRKIKLKMNDVSKIIENKDKKLTEDLTFTVENKEETIAFEQMELLDAVQYTYRTCNSSGCESHSNTQTAKQNTKILKLSFASTDYEGKDMIDFSMKYGKIKYIDSKYTEYVLEIENPISREYSGKYLYIEVPSTIVDAQLIELIYTVRNNRYTYRLK